MRTAAKLGWHLAAGNSLSVNHILTQKLDFYQLLSISKNASMAQIKSAYDARHSYSAAPPRPAQVVSLEDFDEVEVEESWRYTCRCGGSYLITSTLMDEGEHLIACNSCSEVVWVGYELVEL